MKFWIFNHYAIPPGSSGITRDYDLAKRLVRHGHQVTIFASSYDHRSRKERHFKQDEKGFYKIEEYDGIRYVWVRTTPYEGNNINRVLNILSYTVRGFFASRKVTDNPDIVMGTIVHPFAAFLGYAVSKMRKSLFYFEERDLWPETLVHLGKFKPGSFIVKILYQLELFLYKKAKRIIVLFDRAHLYVKSRGISTDKVLYVPNGADLERYDERIPLTNDISEALQILKGKFIGVYTGAHGLANNLDVLLDAAKLTKEKNKDIHFLFVGAGVEKERLHKRALDELLTNVTFIDPIPKEMIPSLLKEADVGLISMWDADLYKWGMSLNKVYDYMAAELPTIIKCNIPDTIVEKANAGYKVLDAVELSEKLLLSFNSRDEIKQKGKNGRKYVEQYHSWDQLANVLLQAMNEDVKQYSNERE
ncbi:glycosyltransferase family 4 protein [Metabacillus herbersteinensis]|uniref:Glycosyltransferase family 4 protein n=1 Tax=Metabacillus herbersteinensis TaxID=283816 RepID=A0ABV6GEY4_9BACI